MAYIEAYEYLAQVAEASMKTAAELSEAVAEISKRATTTCKTWGEVAAELAKSWEPCGLFGKPADRPMVTTRQKMAFARAERPVESRPQIEGQIEMEAIAVEQQQTAP